MPHQATAMPGRWSMQAGWGFAAFGGRLTGTPHFGAGLAGTARDYSIGWRLAPAARPDAPDFTLGVLATRREAIGEKPDHGIGIEIGARW